MSELVSAYPTAGGHLLVGAQARRPGLVLVHGLVQPRRPRRRGRLGRVRCADFMNSLFGYWGWTSGSSTSPTTSTCWRDLLAVRADPVRHSLINIFSTHLLALFGTASRWSVHVVGVAVIIGILVFVPDNHQSFDFVFTERMNNSGFGRACTGGLVLPAGFLLTMYTITGFDASAHIAEETHERLGGGGQGRLAVGRLLGADRLVRAAGDHVRGDRRRRRERGVGGSLAVFTPPT